MTSDSLIAHMRERVARCRTLARGTTDEAMAIKLLQMADEGEADIRAASLKTASGEVGYPSGVDAAHSEDVPSSLTDQLQLLRRGGPSFRITEDHVLSLINARRGREAIFGRHLFSDPAWDVILELYAAKLGERKMTVSGLAKAIDSPPSVVERWMGALIDAGLIRVSADASRRERDTVELTEEGAGKMARLADRWGSAFVSI